ncbi:hypothetical protein C9374_008043 [Naegleria lovaniensis]|uniref:Uncharacterized protein n=1 Tax=Naegleria lovaniensis TaxID=51637 RepID=A0AA88KGU1_NAELO|nr:uncharacterized protein C9374_008043 [Naegleria lovaniensis]KAG2378895.1 hypothetical protein C9374_008043 [Naegleria lovaniensis]
MNVPPSTISHKQTPTTATQQHLQYNNQITTRPQQGQPVCSQQYEANRIAGNVSRTHVNNTHPLLVNQDVYQQQQQLQRLSQQSSCLMTHTPSDLQTSSHARMDTSSNNMITPQALIIQNMILQSQTNNSHTATTTNATPNQSHSTDRNWPDSNIQTTISGSKSPFFLVPTSNNQSTSSLPTTPRKVSSSSSGSGGGSSVRPHPSTSTPSFSQKQQLSTANIPSTQILTTATPSQQQQSSSHLMHQPLTEVIFPLNNCTTKIYDTRRSTPPAHTSGNNSNNNEIRRSSTSTNHLFISQIGDHTSSNYSSSGGFMGLESVVPNNSNNFNLNNNINSNDLYNYLNSSSSTSHGGFVNTYVDSMNIGIERMQQQNINISGLLNSMLSQLAQDHNINSSSSASGFNPTDATTINTSFLSNNQNTSLSQSNAALSEIVHSPNIFINNDMTSIPLTLFGINTSQQHSSQQQLGENMGKDMIFTTTTANNLTLDATTMQQFHLPQAGIPVTSYSHSFPTPTNPSFINTSSSTPFTNPSLMENPSDSVNLTPQSLCNSSTDLPNQFAVQTKRPIKSRRTAKSPQHTTIVPTNFHSFSSSNSSSNTDLTAVGLSSTLNSLNSLLLKKMAVDVYYDITSAGHPFLPREELERLPVNDDQKNNLAFMFSLQALCYQRFGMTKQAADSFEKAKSLALISSNDSNVFNTACTYCNLAMYCNSGGDRENGQIFSKYINFKMLGDPNFREHQNPEQLKALVQMKKIADIAGGVGYYGDDPGLSEVSKLILSIYQYATGGERSIPPEMMMIAKQPLNLETLPQYLSLLDCVMKLMLIYESKGQHFSQTQKKMTKYIYYGMSYGLKILLLKISGYDGPELEEAADKITQLCRTSTFTFVPAFLIEPVGLAMGVHSQILKKIDIGERSNADEAKVSRLLRRDIEAIKLLKLRYPLICVKFDTLVEESEKLLDRRGKYLAELLAGEFYSSNQGGVTIIEDELGQLIEGEVPSSGSKKRKNEDEEDEYSTSRGYSANYVPPKTQIPPNINTAQAASSTPNQGIGNFTFTSIGDHVISGNSNDIGIHPITFLSAEDYELLFGDDDTDDEQPFEL